MQVAIPLHPRFTALDTVGPYPQPPFDAGHPSKVGRVVVDRLGEYARASA